MRIERAAIVAVMLGGAVSIAGCPGLLENKLAFVENEAGTCGDVPTTIFATTCTGSGCHSAVNPAGQLDLQSPNVAARLVDKPAHNDCVGTLADPSAPKDSILYQKLTTAPPCGSRMPLGATPLTDAEIACVATWIGDQQIPGAGGSGGSGGSGGRGGNGGSGGATGGGGTGGSGGATGSGGAGASGGASGGGGAGGTTGGGGAAGGSSVSASSTGTG